MKTKRKNSRVWLAPPRYTFRKLNVVNILKKIEDIDTFVDVGCGAGDISCFLVKNFGYNGMGIDFSSEAIIAANNLKKLYQLSENPSFKRSDANSMKFLKKSDLVMCFEVLEHVEDDSELFSSLYNLTNKYILVSVPAKKRLFSRSDVLAGHYRRYDKKDLQKLLDTQNLEIIKWVSYGYPFTNFLKYFRELILIFKGIKGSESSRSPEERSKKSGVDLMNINKSFWLFNEKVLWIPYTFSRLFNRLDLAEGYLVLLKKKNEE